MALRLNFTPFPMLTTKRLMLRQVTPEDAQEIFSIRANKRVNEFVDRQPPQAIEDALQFINNINSLISNNEVVY
ncbi:MAG: GNAT family N-acetyltransferase [Chitinophagaceae bacterium]|nr:GNAT family N-acetyltransferase [Chitinophagaceae bacterium]